MLLVNGNTVALERRMDLASLFCMIGRHGPAVALAVIAMVSVVAGFIIYRSLRGKRSKATAAAAAAADGDGMSPGAERDASAVRPGPEPSPEEPHRSEESTDVSDEGSSEMKEDANLFHSDLKIRHRHVAAAAAAEKKPPPYSPPESNIQIPDYKHTTSDDTEEMTVAQDSHKVAERYAEDTSHNQPCDTYTVAGVEVEGASDCHRGATGDTVKEVIDEVHESDSCLKEPELINDESHEEEEEKMFKEEYLEDEYVVIDQDVSDEKEEEDFQCASNSQMCFDQTRQQDNETKPETNGMECDLGEPVVHIEDVPVTCICYGKDEEFEEENHHPDSIDYSNYSSSHICAEEEKTNEDEEAEEECVDQQLIPKQDETWSLPSEQETNLPPSQQCDCVTDKVTPPVQDSDWDHDGGLAGEVTEEDVDEDHVLKSAEFDAQPLQFDKFQIEQKDESICNEEDDQVKEETLTSDETVAHDEECENSSAVLSPTLHCLNESVQVDNHNDDLSSVNTDIKAPISDIADFPDSSLDCQQPQSEDEAIAPPLDKDTDLTIIGSDLPSLEKEIQFEKNETGAIVVLAEESIDLHAPTCYEDQPIGQMVNDEDFDKTSITAAPNTVTCDAENIIALMTDEKISHSHVLSCYKDQQSVQVINTEAFDEINVAAGPDTVEKVTAYEISEEMSCPNLPSICQDRKSDYVEIEETSDETRVGSATDATVCDDASITTSEMSEEISRPDTLCFSQDQQNDQTQNNEDFSEFSVSAAPEDLNPSLCQIHLPSSELIDLTDNDKDSMSSPGVREESGISSMTVSPDLQDAGNEFCMTIENMVLPEMHCDPQSEERAEAQNSLFADDVAIHVINEDTTGVAFDPYPSRFSPQPYMEHTDGAKFESCAANEDMFGHELEDSYHRAMEQFVAQIEANALSLTDDLKRQTDVKAAVEVVEIKKKKEGVSVAKKVETEAEEKEEDYEKTEISIMEATMDNNEWITDNYQVLPWMNISVPSLALENTKTDQPPAQECQHSSPLTDAPCIDTDTTPPTEVKQTSTPSLVDEHLENNKKVVAVQPMPQNVNVTFRIHYLTHSPYQTVAVTGNQQELGNWKDFIPLERAKDGHWATVVSLPAESHVEWKFVVVDKGEVCRWEECGNRFLDTGYGDDLIVHKWWGFL